MVETPIRFTLRFEDPVLHRALSDMAKSNGRSLQVEIISRLQSSFLNDDDEATPEVHQMVHMARARRLVQDLEENTETGLIMKAFLQIEDLRGRLEDLEEEVADLRRGGGEE
jgi:hypothetical protein